MEVVFRICTALMYDLTILALKGSTIYFAGYGLIAWVQA